MTSHYHCLYKGRHISDSGMRGLWARIPAGEANSPGYFSKKTVNLMEDIDAIEAARFVSLCGFAWSIGPIIFNTDDAIYTRKGVTFESLSQLENLGLIHFTGLGAVRQHLPKEVILGYHGRSLKLTFAGSGGNKLAIGKVFYSNAGEQIASICNANPIDGFYEYASAKWEAESTVVSIQRFPAPPV